MAVPAHSSGDARSTMLYIGLGTLLYLPCSLLTSRWLNARYRVQMLADALLSLAALLRLQAQQFASAASAASLFC